MEKIIVNAIKFIGYLIITLMIAGFYSVKYVLSGKSIIGRIAILGMYSGMVASFIYIPIVFKILTVGLLLLDALLALSMMKNGRKCASEERNYRNTYEHYKTNKAYVNPFFDGMSFEEAKKEYRKLMKKYHPDNIDGSLEMTQKIAEAYSNYCTACGR